MKKAKNKFLLYAVLSVFVLLFVLLTVINAVNFTMAAEDADEITGMLSASHGAFGQGGDRRPFEMMNPFGPMGPRSPELQSSVRYFTVAISEDGSAETVAFYISAVTEEEAATWAKSLTGASTGWTRGTYRYRIYEDGGRTFVTVIDQSRELLPSFRILIISAVGLVLGTLIGFAVLFFTGEKLFAPLDKADRRQKKFLARAERQFKVPLTVISAETELIEREGGPNEHTRSINTQVRHMGGLVRDLGSLAVFEETDGAKTTVVLSEILAAELSERAEQFAEKGIALKSDIASGVTLTADPDALKRMLDELCENVRRFAKSKAVFILRTDNDRVTLLAENDAELPDGSCDEVFDRFTRLDNAAELESAGLGLSYVKDIVMAHDGRIHAQVTDGVFRLTVSL